MARESKYPFPRFYFKNVGGSISIEHRLTHTYMATVADEKELVSYLKEINKLSPEEFWRTMIDNKVRIPEERMKYGSGSKEKDDAEEWFYNAWSIYTDQFYDKNKKLLVVEENIPYDIIKKIKRENYYKFKEESEKQDKERRAAEEAYRAEQKAEREKQREAMKPKEVVEGKIGSGVGLDKLKRKARKGVKKLKVKTAKVGIVIEDSLDPFA